MTATDPSKTLGGAPAWQRKRALALHADFVALEGRKSAGEKSTALVADIVARRNGEDLGGGHTFKASRSGILAALKKWRGSGRSPAALVSRHKAGAKKRSATIPDALVDEFHRRLTMPLGGRTKNGTAEIGTVYSQLVRDWLAGAWIEGLGDWAHWWATASKTKRHPLPPNPPEFPFSLRSFQRLKPSTALRKLGNVGLAAARNSLPRIDREYAQLRKGELYTLDDFRADIVAIDQRAGAVCEVRGYVMMEVSSRSIVSWILKPADAIKAADVDQLVTWGLGADGFGIGVGYETHIIFERGTVACSKAAEDVLGAATGGSVIIHRTGVDRCVRWVGQAPDVPKGNAAGKAVIESWIRHSLHARLLHLPGQRGNTDREHAPANLGFARNQSAYKTDADPAKEAGRAKKWTTADEAAVLAQFAKRARTLGIAGADQINYPVLTFGQLSNEFGQMVKAHNSDPGHGYRGHHRILQAETAPGVWTDLPGETPETNPRQS